MNKDYNNIPANACTFRGAVEIRDNGDGSTTAPISLLGTIKPADRALVLGQCGA
jgi:hypothetical protein